MKLSIITPVYNNKRFIEQCMTNVIGQNGHEIEHIIVDGGSSDGTVDIIKNYAQRYPHIRWISARDKGQSHAMNKGIALAKGRVVGFLNVDDYFEPGTLVRVIYLFQSLPEPTLLVGNCNVWNDDGTLWLISKPYAMSLENILQEKYDISFPLNPSAYFYHTLLHEKIGLYDVEEHYAMDLDFIIRALEVAHVEYRNELWGNFRYLKGTKTYDDKLLGTAAAREKQIIAYHLKRQPLFLQLKISLWQCFIKRKVKTLRILSRCRKYVKELKPYAR